MTSSPIIVQMIRVEDDPQPESNKPEQQEDTNKSPSWIESKHVRADPVEILENEERQFFEV